MRLNLEEAHENYIVFENGDIFDIVKNKFVHQFSISSGYLMFYCRLLKTDVLVHRFVMGTTNPVDNMDNLQVNHIDGNKHNNSLSNLEWCTCSENLKHAFAHNLHSQTGERNSCAKLTESDVEQIIQKLLLGEKVTSIAKEFNVGHVTISDIKMHRNWAHLTDGITFQNIRKSRKFNDQRN